MGISIVEKMSPSSEYSKKVAYSAEFMYFIWILNITYVLKSRKGNNIQIFFKETDKTGEIKFGFSNALEGLLFNYYTLPVIGLDTVCNNNVRMVLRAIRHILHSILC